VTKDFNTLSLNIQTCFSYEKFSNELKNLLNILKNKIFEVIEASTIIN